MADDQLAAERRRLALVAEDDRDIRELVAAKLAAAGYQVSTAADGITALAELRRLPPDVALLDVMMPGISGLDIIAELRADPRTASIPVILLSAKSQEFDVENGIAIGAADYVIKPFSPRELLARVEAVLERVGR
ncbi:MAG: response regulator [Actinomycetota bacterium]|nr:response regulator [Actinomycetota bacterium]MDQ2959214.1 response regulator [Actinomycetota bacterium]